MDTFILTINVGSSSIKCSLFQKLALTDGIAAAASKTDQNLALLWSASRSYEKDDPEQIERLISEIFDSNSSDQKVSSEKVAFVGHRIVHGGNKYFAAVEVDETVLEDLHSYIELAPQHQPANIKGIAASRKLFAKAKQIACFDTAYFHNMPLVAQTYAVPASWYTEFGIRRFGFHGLSHEYAATQISRLLNKPLDQLKLITCHLGSGSSLAAIKYGAPIMNTMGFTPMAGLIMRSRCGDLDPGLIFYLINSGKYNSAELDDILNYESGLKGISQLSGDLRELELEAQKGNEKAQLALDCFIQSLSIHAGSLLPLLGGLDALVFTGGIGENSSLIRKRLCQSLSFMGLEIDPQKNNRNKSQQGEDIISTANSKVAIALVKCREDLAIAKQCL